MGNGLIASRGVFEEGYPGEWRTTFVHGIFDDAPVSFTELVNAPDWMGLQISLNGSRFRLEVTPTWVPHFSDRTRLVRIWRGLSKSISRLILLMASSSIGVSRAMMTLFVNMVLN